MTPITKVNRHRSSHSLLVKALTSIEPINRFFDRQDLLGVRVYSLPQITHIVDVVALDMRIDLLSTPRPLHRHDALLLTDLLTQDILSAVATRSSATSISGAALVAAAKDAGTLLTSTYLHATHAYRQPASCLLLDCGVLVDQYISTLQDAVLQHKM